MFRGFLAAGPLASTEKARAVTAVQSVFTLRGGAARDETWRSIRGGMAVDCKLHERRRRSAVRVKCGRLDALAQLAALRF